MSHGGNKVLISGVEGPCWGIQIREGVRRNRLQKWKAASCIFDFGGPFKDHYIYTSINAERGVLSVLCPNSSPYYALILIRTMP